MSLSKETPITDLIEGCLAEGVDFRTAIGVARRFEQTLYDYSHPVSRKRPQIKGPFYVYQLIDPRHRNVFYIGMTIQPTGRLSGHKSDPCSAAYDRCQDIMASGLQVEMEILRQFENREDAAAHERHLIAITPGLTNRERLGQ